MATSEPPVLQPAAPSQSFASPGWYPDPWRVAPARWWDGITWTGFTAPRPADGRSGALASSRSAAFVPAAPGPSQVPRARDDLRGGGVALLGFFGAQGLGLVGAILAIAAGASTRSVGVLVMSQVGLWTGLCLAAYIVTRRRTGGTFADLGFTRLTPQEVGLGIGVGFTGLFVAAPVITLLRHLFPDDGGSTVFLSRHPSYSYALVSGVIACIGAPVVEELFFRGLVQSVLARSLGATPAIAMQALVFGAAHFQLGMTFNQAAVRCGTVAVLGLFLGWLRSRTGRLGAGMAAHATNNAIVTLLAFAALAAR